MEILHSNLAFPIILMPAGCEIAGLMGKIPGLNIPLKGDFGLIGFAVSVVLLFGVSYLTRQDAKCKNKSAK
jgi:hypothetical protein